MPIVELKFLKNLINANQEKILIEKITQIIVDITSCSRDVVTIIFDEIKKDGWGSSGKATNSPLYHPIVIIDILIGKTKKQKADIIKAITNSVCEITNCPQKKAVIIFRDVQLENWGSNGIPKKSKLFDRI